MRSAVVMARQKAEEESQTNGKAAGSSKPGDLGAGEGSNIRVETNGAVFDKGKVYLKGNPLHTTKDVLCPECGLPRLLYPTTGAGARPPPDPYKQYCQNHPFIRKPGHDVHGNPFATDKPNPKKKKQAQATDTPGSSPPTTPDGSSKQGAAEKVSFPTVKCQGCPRYFIVGRLAQHMDRCMGFSGRQAGRNKNSADNVDTPSSTGGLPKRPLGDEETPGTPTKKKKYNPKKQTGKKPPPPSSKLKNGITPDMAADAGPSGDGEIQGETNGDTNA